MERYSIANPKSPGTHVDGEQAAPMPWPSDSASAPDIQPQALEEIPRSGIAIEPKADVTPSPDAPTLTLQFPGEDGGKSLADMAQRDLDATLRLLAERAQYITEATGAAIALCDADDMVCRASAGSSAPEMGAHLQVDSGLTGESVRTREILHCEDAATDARVNRESCQALGIASVVVMPLVREQEVSGLFELFSDKPHAFTQRDIAALERLGEMVQTALDHAEAARTVPQTLAPMGKDEGHDVPEAAKVTKDLEGTDKTRVDVATAAADVAMVNTEIESPVPDVAPTSAVQAVTETHQEIVSQQMIPSTSSSASEARASEPATGTSKVELAAKHRLTAAELFSNPAANKAAALASAAPAVLSSIRKCEKCGFPISVGRTLCLDCEPKVAKPSTPASALAMEKAESELAALPSMSDLMSDERKPIFRNPYVIAALVVAIVLVLALWMSHSS